MLNCFLIVEAECWFVIQNGSTMRCCEGVVSCEGEAFKANDVTEKYDNDNSKRKYYRIRVTMIKSFQKSEYIERK